MFSPDTDSSMIDLVGLVALLPEMPAASQSTPAIERGAEGEHEHADQRVVDLVFHVRSYGSGGAFARLARRGSSKYPRMIG